MRQAIIDVLGELANDDAVKAVVIVGSGGFFCAGFDLDELMAAEDQGAVFAHSTAYHQAVHTFTKPLVAAIEGAAVAGGLDLALLCDVRVSASNARFGQPQVKMGVPAAFDLVKTVVRESTARDLCLTGRIMNADEAAAVGLVDRMVEQGEALNAAVELASEMAASAGSAVMKQAFLASQPDLFGGAR